MHISPVPDPRLSRRTFLKIAGGTVAAGAMPFGPFSHAAQVAADNGKILVVVMLYGGNDGLNTLIPYADPDYYSNRTVLGVPEAQLAGTKISDTSAYHPSLDAFYRLYQEGVLCNVQGVGYGNSSRSHFTSTDIWRTANVNPFTAGGGWVARCGKAGYVGDRPESVVGVHRLDGMLLAPGFHAASITSLAGFDFTQKNSTPLLTTKYIRELCAQTVPADSELAHLQSTGLQTCELIDTMAAAAGYTPQREYPNTTFAQDLRLVSQIIHTGIATRVFHTGFSGFDTHSNQNGRQPKLLQTLGDALETFYLDLTDNNRHEDVLVCVISEFGRRVKENASGGTDHGSGNVGFVLGPVARTSVGPPPDLDADALYRGDVLYSIDFRAMYAEIIEKWFSADSVPILGEQYEHPGILLGIPPTETPTPTSTATPTDTNTPTPTSAAMADLYRDGRINSRDLFEFALKWGKGPSSGPMPEDLVQDGSIDAADLFKLIEQLTR